LTPRAFSCILRASGPAPFRPLDGFASVGSRPL
jgi:hypothetical protein